MSFIDAYKSLVDFDASNDRKKKVEKKKVIKKDTMKKEETRKRSRSKSPQKKVEPVEEVIDPDIPSRQFGDLYCKVCDSHMNSEQMWESHIIGKRHLKSTRKGEAAEPKYEYLDDEPIIQKELDKDTRPIAGLDQICEIWRNNQPPIYQCFLCSASLQTPKSLFDHIVGLKHQMAFLRENLKEEKSIVDAAKLPKASLEPIVQDLISKYEMEHGRGKMAVKKEKSGSFSLKKSDTSDRQQTSKSKHTSLLKSSKPPPKAARYSPRTPSYSPPPKSSRYSPPPRAYRNSPPPKSYRDSPPKSYRDSPPPKSYRDSPPKSYRDSPPKSYRDSPPKSYRKKERNLESQWEKISPNRERSRERMYSDMSYYSDEEKWKKIETDSTYYRRIATDQDSDVRLDQASKYRSALSVSDAGKNCSDLRAVLEQKKNLGMASAAARANMDMSTTSNPDSFEINSVSERLYRLVSDMSPEVLLKLTLFKLDSMIVQEEIELEYLDRVANKASALSLAVKKRLSAIDLESRYRETLAQNGISNEVNTRRSTSPQKNLQFTQNLDDLIGHYKARKTTGYEDEPSKDSYYNLLTASEQYKLDKPSSHLPLYSSPQYRNTPERASTFDSGWNQRSSTSSLPFQSFSSTPSSIPGLTLTEESSQPSTSAVLSQFAQTAKGIFGNINVPSTNTYQNEDYNRLTYRY